MIVVAVVALLLFGGRKLPELGKRLRRRPLWIQRWNKGLTDELDGSKVTPPVAVTTENAG
jgi:Sec-independent protein translocase protein TatA